MSEADVITACENLCRDFSWIFPSDPRIIQGLLTLLAAILTSATVLYVALRAYPIQKLKDKEIQIQAETRAVYAETIAILGDYLSMLCRSEAYIRANLEDEKSAWTKLVHQQGVLQLYGSQAVNSEVSNFVKLMEEYKEIKLDSTMKNKDHKEWRTKRLDKNRECRTARTTMVRSMRSDLHQPPVTDFFSGLNDR